MNNGLLLLHPVELDLDLPETPMIIQQLQTLGLVGQASPYNDEIFLPGDDFLRHITFLGCSPFNRLEPESETDLGFCHITLTGPADTAKLRHGKNTRPPVCPACHKRITEWHVLTQPDSTRKPHCPHCDTTSPIEQLGWKNNAGIARLFIEIHNIFPGEAVPLEGFMTTLGKVLGGQWSHFYLLPHEADQHR